MRNRIAMGLVFVVLGLLTAILPQTLFHACTGMLETVSGMMVPMKCVWTARMASGMGVLFCLCGIFLFLGKTASVRLGISMVLFLNGLLLAAVPTFLIGVCQAETMPCRTGMLPALIVLSVLILVFSLGNIIYLHGQSEKEKGGRS